MQLRERKTSRQQGTKEARVGVRGALKKQKSPSVPGCGKLVVGIVASSILVAGLLSLCVWPSHTVARSTGVRGSSSSGGGRNMNAMDTNMDSDDGYGSDYEQQEDEYDDDLAEEDADDDMEMYEYNYEEEDGNGGRDNDLANYSEDGEDTGDDYESDNDDDYENDLSVSHWRRNSITRTTRYPGYPGRYLPMRIPNRWLWYTLNQAQMSWFNRYGVQWPLTNAMDQFVIVKIVVRPNGLYPGQYNLWRFRNRDITAEMGMVGRTNPVFVVDDKTGNFRVVVRPLNTAAGAPGMLNVQIYQRVIANQPMMGGGYPGMYPQQQMLMQRGAQTPMMNGYGMFPQTMMPQTPAGGFYLLGNDNHPGLQFRKFRKVFTNEFLGRTHSLKKVIVMAPPLPYFPANMGNTML
eukprot:Nk52_evm7s366 gene=Nk52_evmTU7s366